MVTGESCGQLVDDRHEAVYMAAIKAQAENHYGSTADCQPMTLEPVAGTAEIDQSQLPHRIYQMVRWSQPFLCRRP
jgi:hypothetical protein